MAIANLVDRHLANELRMYDNYLHKVTYSIHKIPFGYTMTT